MSLSLFPPQCRRPTQTHRVGSGRTSVSQAYAAAWMWFPREFGQSCNITQCVLAYT